MSSSMIFVIKFLVMVAGLVDEVEEEEVDEEEREVEADASFDTKRGILVCCRKCNLKHPTSCILKRVMNNKLRRKRRRVEFVRDVIFMLPLRSTRLRDQFRVTARFTTQ